MPIQTHRAELETLHRALEQKIHKSQKYHSCDDLKIAELKRRKLAYG